MPHIVVRKPGLLPYTISLGDVLRIGRHESNDLVLDDSQVSRRHATLTRKGKSWALEDNGSRHGVLCNGTHLTSGLVGDGDKIQIGNVLLEVHEGDERTIVHHQVTELHPAKAPMDRRLALLFDVSRAIGAMGDTDSMFGSMLEAILDVFGCERALVGLGDAERGITRKFSQT